jgi:protein phosphatase 1G
MDEMMKGQRGWRELNGIGEKGQGNKITGMLESMKWSPKAGDSDKLENSWESEEVKLLI